jgi:hypothetical protein
MLSGICWDFYVSSFLAHRKCHCYTRIQFRGDVHMNPGPIKYPCTNCKKGVRSNQRAIQCDFCDEWTHMKCTTISLSQYNKLSTSDETFYCTNISCESIRHKNRTEWLFGWILPPFCSSCRGI